MCFGAIRAESIVPPPGMLRDAEKLLIALHWHGVAMVEFKLDGQGQYWLMEINPRLWGSLALSIDAGVDFPMGLLQISRGQQPAAQPPYKAPYYTRDLRTDVDWLKSNQSATGAWGGFSVNKNRDPASHSGKFMSDAATAFAVLALSH